MTEPSRILVVDDTPTNLLILQRSLEKAGYDVLTATDGFQAVETASRYLPSLILLDVVMPKRDGLETCRILKNQERTAAIPVIFVTELSQADQVLEAFSVGGCDYVTKPFTSEEVLARVSVHVSLRRAEEELHQRNQQAEGMAKQLAEVNLELTRLSRIEPLTKLLNRRTWEEAMHLEHERFLRHGNQYSIIMVDVDHFKAFNDSHGHQAGDNCLQQMSATMASSCRQADVLGRYGGEEFIILAPETAIEAAIRLAERVRRAVWALALPHPASLSGDRVTISLGVAVSGPQSWESVLKKADDALYVAKKAGRNMVYGGEGALPQNSPSLDPALTQGTSDVCAEDSGERRVRVLVVDDSATNRAICQTSLERAGYEVDQAVDGLEALERVRENPPHVIVMDVMMPNLDGLECTRRLKADPDTCDIPIVVVSTLAEGEDILAGLEAGADEYLTKPIRTNELALRVRTMARQYQDRLGLLSSYQIRGEHVRILVRLVDFCREISTTDRLDKVLERTVEAVADLTGSQRVSIMLPDPQKQRLTVRCSLGIDQNLADAMQVPVGEPLAGQVFASGRPIVINSADESHPGSGNYDSLFFASVPLVSAPLGASGDMVGVLNVTERVGQRPFKPEELEYLELLTKVAGTVIHDLQSRHARDRASESIMVTLARLAEHRDNDTGLHLDRVTQYCRLLAEELRHTDRFRDQIDDAFMSDLARSVPLHDIGKVAIPDHILQYPGKLSEKQMTTMRTHAAVGAKTIGTLVQRLPNVDFLRMAADIAHYHHEWHDGSGYPLGLKGDAIPLSARITAVADVYDALTTERVYKRALDHDKAMTIVIESSGTQFDPAAVEAFIKREKDFAELAVTMADSPSTSAPPLLTAGVPVD